METNSSQLFRTLRTIMVVLSFIVGSTEVYAGFDFSVECETGQMLYYLITDTVNYHVELSCPNLYWQGYSEPKGDVLLPVSVSYDGIEYNVTSIGSNAFNGCFEMNPLNIPVTVTHIGSLALSYTAWYSAQPDGILYFDNCCLGYKGNMPTGTLSIQEGTRVIADEAFMNCNNLIGNLIIPGSVITIGAQAFRGCSGFTGELSFGNLISMIGGGAFWGCTQLTGNLILPNSLTTIYGSTFKDCGRLTGDLIIPDSVREIGWSAFQNCTGFTGNLIIGNSVTFIDDLAFQNCRSFSGILTIGNSVSKLGEYVFQYCTSISEVHYNTTNQVELVSHNNTPFDNCGGKLVICDNVTSIPDCIFRNSCFTGDLTIPNSVNTIGVYSFEGCNKVSGCITIPNSVIEIGWGAFEGCNNAREIRFESSNCADLYSSFPPFRNCSGTVVIGENVTRIPSYLFTDSKIQGELLIPNSVTSIGDYAFFNCNGLTGSITIPNSVISLGKYAFYNCYNLNGSLSIPSSITAIGDYTFYNCYSINGGLSIPSSITQIGDYAFYNCHSLTGTLIIPTSVSSIGKFSFAKCSGFFSNLVIPNLVRTIDESAFYNCSGLTGSLIIGNLVRTIRDKAFYGCDGFSTVIALGILPSSLGNEVFTGTENDKLYVQCDKKELFLFSEWGDYFENQNIEEDCSFHNILISNGTINGGSVQTSVTSAKMGTEISIISSPLIGFVLYDVIVSRSDDESLTIPVVNNTFIMPKFDVTVTPVFSHTSIYENNRIFLSIYPNPTNGKVKIETEDIRHIRICNLFGQIIYEGKISCNEFEYDFNKHGKGVYLIRIETASGVATKRVVVAL